MSTLLASFYLGILLTALSTGLYFLFLQIKRKKDLEDSLTLLKRKIKSNDADSKDYYLIGTIYLSKGLFDQAILNFSYSLKNWDKSDRTGVSSLYNAIGFTYFESEQLDMSIYYYQEATKIKPDYVVALNNLAHSYEKKRMFKEARDIYKKALFWDKNNSTANEKLQIVEKKIKNSG
jgi:tetratricopeptide (TPR) repeat protein